MPRAGLMKRVLGHWLKCWVSLQCRCLKSSSLRPCRCNLRTTCSRCAASAAARARLLRNCCFISLQLMAALETKIDAEGCSKKAKVCQLRSLLLSPPLILVQLAASSAQAACRLAKEKVVPCALAHGSLHNTCPVFKRKLHSNAFDDAHGRASGRCAARSSPAPSGVINRLPMPGKAGLSSTSQQLQLLQQVQRAQNVHAVLVHVQRRRVLACCSVLAT